MDSEVEVKYTLPKPGEGIFVVAYINPQALGTQTLDTPSFHETVLATLTRNIGDISICHDNYNRPNGYVFIRVFEHLPVNQQDIDRFRASTYKGVSITARLFKDEDEFKEYLDLFSSSILKKIPLEPPSSQLQLLSIKTKYKPTYHHIYITDIKDKFQIKSLITEYAPIKKEIFFSANGKDYADFYFLKVNDVRNIYKLYEEGKILLDQGKMFAFYGTVQSKHLMINDVLNEKLVRKQIEEFGEIAEKQYIPDTKQLILEMRKTAAAGRAACILHNEINLSIYTIHEGYYQQLQKKYAIKEENNK